MRIAGIILIVIGILMAVFTSINFTTKEKVVDLGPLEINKEKENHIDWPVWIGGVAAIAGVVMVVAGKKK